jgi:hypothetical protein
MGFSPGEESLPDGVAAQAIEAQPVSGQISHQRGKVRPGAETASSGEDVADAGCAAEDAGEFRRKERSHSVGKGGSRIVCRRNAMTSATSSRVAG